MHAVDSNVLVRLLTGDDAGQTKRAAALFKKQTVYLSKTALLETEWVLRRLYRLEHKVVVSALRKVSGLANVEIENPLVITQALRWCDGGMDFADALPLASSHASEKFATFDAHLKKSSPKDTKQSIVLL